MAEEPAFDLAWRELNPIFRTCLGLAWESLCRRGLAVGSAVSLDGEVFSTGRNRVFDPLGGTDALQRTPLAHAEMNAIAAVPDDVDLSKCVLWSTQQPCSMCRAAIDFTAISASEFLATDPSSPAEDSYASSGKSDHIWIVAANVLFLHNVIWVGGKDNPIVGRNRRHEPEVTQFTLDLAAERLLILAAENGALVEDALAGVWERLAAVSSARLFRQQTGGGGSA